MANKGEYGWHLRLYAVFFCCCVVLLVIFSSFITFRHARLSNRLTSSAISKYAHFLFKSMGSEYLAPSLKKDSIFSLNRAWINVCIRYYWKNVYVKIYISECIRFWFVNKIVTCMYKQLLSWKLLNKYIIWGAKNERLYKYFLSVKIVYRLINCWFENLHLPFSMYTLLLLNIQIVKIIKSYLFPFYIQVEIYFGNWLKMNLIWQLMNRLPNMIRIFGIKCYISWLLVALWGNDNVQRVSGSFVLKMSSWFYKSVYYSVAVCFWIISDIGTAFSWSY